MCSMLSAQVDKLRERAKTLRQGRWSDGADDARLMEDAADTISELRGMVHKERAEADRLRGELEAVGTAAYLYGRDDIKAENAKLRELVCKVEHYERLGCHECPYEDGCEAYTLYDEECPMSREIKRMKRELGFEVD